MTKAEMPITPAVRLLREKKIEFAPHFYNYEERSGTKVSSRELGVEEHIVIKTLVMETDAKKPLIVIMHGDCQVSTKNLAREMKVKSVSACEPDKANLYSGYTVGGTSPFATRKVMPVFMQRSIADLEHIFINGGKRGFLIKIKPSVVLELLKPQLVDIIA